MSVKPNIWTAIVLLNDMNSLGQKDANVPRLEF
jgi:hypothetical protein